MRLQAITLTWFRGAAVHAQLSLGGNSTVVYGVNGAGKSSFVDGIEAVLSGGKLGHLAHEYSGRFQEKGLVNTARPAGQISAVEVTLANGTSETLTWTSGSATKTKQGDTSLDGWDYRRTALRQEELSGFIRATKGDKYGAVLPLLGLAHLETTAENLHKLIKAVERKGDLPSLRAKVATAAERRREVFGEQTSEQLVARLDQLREAYVPSLPKSSLAEVAIAVLGAVEDQIASLSADQRRAAAIGEVGASDLQSRLTKASETAAKIAEVAEPLIREHLDVLGAADRFANAIIGIDALMKCPACGREIEAGEFREHVDGERERLAAAQALFDTHRNAVEEVCEEVGRLRAVIAKEDLAGWLGGLGSSLKEGIAYLSSLSMAELRTKCSTDDLVSMREKVGPLVAQATEDAKTLPPQVQTLVDHQNELRVLFGSIKAGVQRAAVNRADALIALIKGMEAGAREEIAKRARETFGSITADVQRYWKILQPNDVITDIRLVVPDDNDKAVEVALRFHGKAQDSPRLTLSEGQRNALGLCIFLAMANKASDADNPIILDDVVISFDREHRSRVGVLLNEEFATRQLVLLTHDREWFFELQRTLPRKGWGFQRLKPYSTPSTGIKFADHGLDFAGAKARALTEPEEALGNTRRLMDVALGEVAEKIGLSVPHLRGDANDHRTAGQFLVALERAAPKSFRKKSGDGYVSHTEALEAIRRAKPELAIWGNRGTHTFSGSTIEAQDLIAGCEAVLRSFVCESCDTSVGAHEAAQGKVECRCGCLQWRPE